MNRSERALVLLVAAAVANLSVCGGAEAPTYATLYQFTGYLGGPDGSYPIAPVVVGSGGVLFGTTRLGGVVNAACPQGCGTVFSPAPPTSAGMPWAETILHSFSAGGDAYWPSAALTIDPKGILYGTTVAGGPPGFGVIFSLAPPADSGGPWTERILHDFAGPVGPGADGVSPYASLLIGEGGVLYGTASLGGAYGGGRRFRLRRRPRGGLGPKPSYTALVAKATAPPY